MVILYTFLLRIFLRQLLQFLLEILPSAALRAAPIAVNGRQVLCDPNWDYAEFAKITSGTAVLYQSQTAERKNLTICVNAGHGTLGGASVKTQCLSRRQPQGHRRHYGSGICD
jgi:hypothetical protein